MLAEIQAAPESPRDCTTNPSRMHLETQRQQEIRMKRLTSILSLALVLGLLGGVSLAFAADTVVTTTEKTTTYTGVVSAIDPGASTLIVKSETKTPVTYNFTKETVFVDAQGNVVSSETIRDAPVTVEYLNEGDRTIVRRVVMTRPSSVIRTEETRTVTE
jgi:hypothetical protein